MFRRLADALGAPGGACGAVRYLSSGPARPSVATLPRRTVLSLEGRDTFKFLQGAITNNVQRLEDERRTGGIVRDVFYAAFLNPQGRMVADALLYHRTQASEPSVLIEVDAQVEGELVKFLKRFKLRSKFRITDVSDAWDVRQVWGPGAEQLIDSAPTDDPHVVAVRDVRAPSMGWRVLSPAGETPDQVSPEEYTVHRMLSGVPEGADELTSGTSLPLECCVDYMNGVDFHKGCYIGQELTARTHFTGLIRKRVMPVMLTRPDAPAPQPPHADPAHIHALPAHGADVRLTSAQQADNGGKPRRARSAGKFLGGVQNVGLALLRLEQVTQTQNGPSSPQLLIECADGTSAQLHAWRPAWWPANTDDRGE